MKRQFLSPILIFVAGLILLLPGFYRNKWNIVEPARYEYWQITVDRTVVARLVKSRQDGIFSDGGLLGLGDVKAWNFLSRTNRHQYSIYIANRSFKSYFPYRSHPGFQAIPLSLFDKMTNLSETTNLRVFRGVVALSSAMIMALLAVGFGIEFGWLGAILMLICAAFSEWLTLPAGSIFWNLWSMYLPFATSAFCAALGSGQGTYRAKQIHTTIYLACMVKILVSGFEAITTVLVMTTVPYVYYGILQKWQWKDFFNRVFKLGLVFTAAVLTGLIILSIQIYLVDGSFSAASAWILKTLDRRAFGNPADYAGTTYYEGMQASAMAVVLIYLRLRAVAVALGQWKWEIPFWQLFGLFALVSTLFLIRSRRGLSGASDKGRALIISMWYSILAPLSWLIIFRPNSFNHTALYPMIWYMPSMLLGMVLCGFVLQDLFHKRI